MNIGDRALGFGGIRQWKFRDADQAQAFLDRQSKCCQALPIPYRREGGDYPYGLAYLHGRDQVLALDRIGLRESDLDSEHRDNPIPALMRRFYAKLGVDQDFPTKIAAQLTDYVRTRLKTGLDIDDRPILTVLVDEDGREHRQHTLN